MSRSIFTDPNVQKWLFFRFDTPSEAKIEGVYCEYCDPFQIIEQSDFGECQRKI